MVQRLHKKCPRCGRKGRGLMHMFDETNWLSFYVCQLCGAKFKHTSDGILIYEEQYVTKKSPPEQPGKSSGASGSLSHTTQTQGGIR